MFDMCTILAKRAERLADLRARKAAIEARRTMSQTTTRSTGTGLPSARP
jgi:hypothetical protein